VLVLSGRPAPGMHEGVLFERVAELWPADYGPMMTPIVGPGGDFGFSPFVTGTSQRQFYVYRDDVLTRVTGAGDLIPGTPEGYRFSGLYGAPAWDGTTLYFRASTYDTRLGYADMWSWDGEQARLHVENGMPGLPPGGTSSVFVASGGWVVFRINETYWSERDGVFTRLIGPGDAAPGMPEGTTIHSLHSLDEYLVDAMTSTSGHFIVNGVAGGVEAVWRVRCDDGSAELVARAGERLAGMSEDETLTDVIGEGTGSEVMYLWATIRRDGVSRRRFWRGEPGSFVPYFRIGQAAPQLESMTIPFFEWARSFGQGGFFLLAEIAGGDPPVRQGKCVWIDGGDGLRLVARTGVPLPYLPLGERVRLPDIDHADFAWIMASPNGRIVFRGRIALEGESGYGRPALLTLDRIGRARLAVAAGQTVEVGPGQYREVESIGSFSIGDDGTIIAGVVLNVVDGEYMDAIVRVHVDCADPACDYADVAGNDCAVTLDDLAAVLANFGREGPLLSGDADLNDRVDVDDLTHVLVTFGMRCDE